MVVKTELSSEKLLEPEDYFALCNTRAPLSTLVKAAQILQVRLLTIQFVLEKLLVVPSQALGEILGWVDIPSKQS